MPEAPSHSDLDLAALLEQSADLSALTDDALPTLADQLRAAAAAELDAAVESGDVQAIDAALASEASVTTALATIATATTERDTAAAELAQRVADARARLTVVPEAGHEDTEDEPETPEGEAPEADTPEAPAADAPEAPAAEVVEPEVVPIAAAATPPVSRVAVTRPRHTAPRTPAPVSDPRMQLVASANAPGVPAGQVLIDGDRIYEDRIAALFENALQVSRNYRGGRMEMPLMSLGTSAEAVYGETRTLGLDHKSNEQKINRITSPAALVASGGICAPTPVDYDLPILGSDARPVRDALARFGADRGGVRLLPAVTMGQTAAGVGAWTNANDITPASPTTKPCVALTCPDATETLVEAITHCMTVGNFRARFFPEQVAAWTRQMAVWTARFAESRHLTTIGAASSTLAAGQIGGSSREVLDVVIRSATQMRSRYRLDPTTPIHAIMPAWLRDNMIVDLTRDGSGGPDRLTTDYAYINSLFSRQNINVTWTLDGESGQIYGTQGDDAALNGWLSTVIIYMYPEGSWLHLDGGTLDLGLVRDSVLNGTNDLQMFGETFENVAFHGYESQRITVDICPSGITQAPATFDPCTTGS